MSSLSTSANSPPFTNTSLLADEKTDWPSQPIPVSADGHPLTILAAQNTMALRIYGNRSLKTLPGKNTRPTPARVREALFNIWQGAIVDCRWLDVCTGSGAMGAEALCRGAESVTGIEQSSQACSIIRHNWQQVIRPDQTTQILRGHVLKQLPALVGQQFDRIYFDPPYASELYQPVLEAIATHQLLADGGEMAVEHRTALSMPDLIPLPGINASHPPTHHQQTNPQVRLAAVRHKTYGTTALTFYRHTALTDEC